jgi:hypothetical protein
MRSQRFATLSIAAIVLSLGVAPRIAHADAKKKIMDMNKAAMEDYDLLDFEGAKKQLLQALTEIKKNKLEKSPVAVTTNINLGIVYGAGLKDPDQAVQYFGDALAIDPKATLPAAYKSPDLEKLFTTAKSNASSGGGDGGDGGDGGGGDNGGGGDGGGETVQGFQHTPVDSAKGGQSIKITAQVGADVKAKQVLLYYRAAGEEDFHETPMKSDDGTTYTATIPKGATKGDTVQYYLAAKNGSGKVVAGKGDAGSPELIEVSHPEGGGGDTGDGEDHEKPPGLEGDGGGDGGDHHDGNTTIKKGASLKPKHKVFLGVNVGSGIGLVTGKTEQENQNVSCCFAPAPFHVQPELGFWLSPKLILSVYGRIGFLVGADLQGHATAAPAGFLRLAYNLGHDGDGLQVHGDAGGGFIRDTVKLSMPTMGTIDTLVSGPIFIGGGITWSKSLADSLLFVAGVNVLAGIPAFPMGTVKPQFALSTDVNIGLAFAF